ncbi:MAG: hypothetical protein CVV24_03100 [Ignavibacteriae bacterium HGW-Ignavibacteriae-3]|nr:MAG: hypothetical protein CVV24_03100 [Ignavibacteriae bacterium HGW-Ignavibacteriae-3]
MKFIAGQIQYLFKVSMVKIVLVKLNRTIAAKSRNKWLFTRGDVVSRNEVQKCAYKRSFIAFQNPFI